MIVFSSTFLLDKNKECVIFFEKNTPIIWINKKSRTQSEKRILCLSILVQVICSVAHSFRALRCLAVNDTHTIGQWECWLTAWSQFRTLWVEIVVPVAQRSCCERRVACLFRCLQAVSIKYRYSLEVVACLRSFPGLCPAFYSLQRPVPGHWNHTLCISNGFCYLDFCL